MEENEGMDESEKENAICAELSEPEKEKENEEEDTDVLRLIDTRFEANEFPAVQPKEVPEEQISTATAIIDMVRKVEHVRIQSYIDKKYAEYRELLPEEDSSETLVKARWARDTYYFHVKEMKTLMAEENSDFIPEVNPNDLNLEAQAEASTILRTLSTERVPFFLELVKMKWSNALMDFPLKSRTEAFQKSDKGKCMKTKWLHKNYYQLMKECVSTPGFSSTGCGEVRRQPDLCFTYKPELKTDELSTEMKEKAEVLYPLVTEDIAKK